MTGHVDDLLPFYANGTLADEKRVQVQAHLASCEGCRLALQEWEMLAAGLPSIYGLRQGERPGAAHAPAGLPALSPVVRASLRGRLRFPEAAWSAANLIAAQRISLKQGGLIAIEVILLLAWVSLTLVLKTAGNTWGMVPLFILAPFFAALGVGILDPLEEDPAWEILAATPTRPGVLFFARLTLALGLITGLALLGSLWISWIHQVPLFGLVAAWLGPVLWLSGLTTLLALMWGPRAAAAVSIALWGGILLLLFPELRGVYPLGFALLPLFNPGWVSFAWQATLAGALWLASWIWMLRGAPPALRLERGG